MGRRTIVLILVLTAGLPAGYAGVTIARGAAINMRADDPMMLQSGIISAEAMAWRDTRGQAMATQDWAEIESQLLDAYRLLWPTHKKAPDDAGAFELL